MPTPVKDLLDNQFAMRIGGLQIKSSNLTFTKSGTDILVTLTFTITPHQIGKGPILRANDPCGVFNIQTTNVLGTAVPQVTIANDSSTNYITMTMNATQSGVKGEHGNTVKDEAREKKDSK